jgi:hypothetical protein
LEIGEGVMDRKKAMDIIGEAGFDIFGPLIMKREGDLVRFVRPDKPTYYGEKLINLVNLVEKEIAEGLAEVKIEPAPKYRCDRCEDTGYVSYYHDAGDHFSAGPAPNSGYRKRPCDKCDLGKSKTGRK